MCISLCLQLNPPCRDQKSEISDDILGHRKNLEALAPASKIMDEGDLSACKSSV